MAGACFDQCAIDRGSADGSNHRLIHRLSRQPGLKLIGTVHRRVYEHDAIHVVHACKRCGVPHRSPSALRGVLTKTPSAGPYLFASTCLRRITCLLLEAGTSGSDRQEIAFGHFQRSRFDQATVGGPLEDRHPLILIHPPGGVDDAAAGSTRASRYGLVGRTLAIGLVPNSVRSWRRAHPRQECRWSSFGLNQALAGHTSLFVLNER
ncbi:MAG: hypothetical protein CBC35_01680 [Planctomycetes bacterium TMED75]|nr:hypothetical protein [Planctomycetaceae bacterium]OUU96269.1 MAG: hypothetical protein CBC35_01680 [Planctomycetes bacterium TMED75]